MEQTRTTQEIVELELELNRQLGPFIGHYAVVRDHQLIAVDISRRAIKEGKPLVTIDPNNPMQKTDTVIRVLESWL